MTTAGKDETQLIPDALGQASFISRRAKVNIEVNVKEPQKFGESEDESRDVERLICDPL